MAKYSSSNSSGDDKPYKKDKTPKTSPGKNASQPFTADAKAAVFQSFKDEIKPFMLSAERRQALMDTYGITNKQILDYVNKSIKPKLTHHS